MDMRPPESPLRPLALVCIYGVLCYPVLYRFTVCMVYYALAMRSGDLGSNRYVSFSLSGLVEIPAIFLASKLLNM